MYLCTPFDGNASRTTAETQNTFTHNQIKAYITRYVLDT